MILSIDPGKDKCGMAVMDAGGNVLERKVLPRENISSNVPLLIARYGIATIVVGRGSFGKEMEKELSRLDLGISVVFISESFSTVEARKRYWRENRPKGWKRLIPTSLLSPPVPVDDYAAVILGERYLKG